MVDDLAEIRAMVVRVIRARTDCEVVGEAENGAIAVREARRLKPDVVILDLQMPVMGGFAAAKLIKQSLPDTVIGSYQCASSCSRQVTRPTRR